MGRTSIEWCDYSWPVVNGCRRISPGCENCYAERLIATRLSKTPKYGGLAVFRPGKGPRWTGESRLWTKDLEAPLRIKKPSKIFVADMGDLFYEEVPNEEIAAVFGVMVACPQHTFQVLTKRPERARDWFRWIAEQGRRLPELIGETPPRSTALPAAACTMMVPHDVLSEGQFLAGTIAQRWPLPNVWLGVSVENQEYADKRIPVLLETPATVRFVSAEPLLGPVDLSPYLEPGTLCECDHREKRRCEGKGPKGWIRCNLGLRRLDWTIVGGESGHGARPFCEEWARAIVEQCKTSEVSCFVKQLGSYYCFGDEARPHHRVFLNDRKGGDPIQWPEDLRVRQFPEVRP